jgi:catechol 2,3-dioxygenase-like lactoylglutathione lyase family enzyme
VKHTPIVTLDHISVPVRDLELARKFYANALGALGMTINMEVSDAFGMGSKKEKIFWLVKDKKAAGEGHYALRVDNREEVHAFHSAALSAGGKNNGKPGLRPAYGQNYYAAFVRDGEGNNIEVVCYGRGMPQARSPRQSASKTSKASTTRVATRSANTTGASRSPGNRRTGAPAKAPGKRSTRTPTRTSKRRAG